MARPGGMKPVVKAKDFKGSLRKLFNYVRPFYGQIGLVVVMAVSSTVIGIFGPAVSGQATTLLYEGVVSKYQGGAGIDFVAIGKVLMTLTSMYVVSMLITYVANWSISGISVKISYRLRKEISEKIDRLPLKYFDTKTHGEVLSRVTNDVDMISRNLSNTIQEILTSIITVIGVLAMMIVISWKLTLIALIVVPLSGMLAMGVVKISQRYFYQQQQLLGEINGHIEEVYSGHLVVKAFNYEADAQRDFDDLNKRLHSVSLRAQFLSAVMMPLTGFIGNMAYVAVCILGGFEAINGRLSIGNIQAFVQYVRRLNQPITQASQLMNSIQSMVAAAERVFEVLDEEEMEPEALEPVKNSDGRGQVVFENVRFGYNPEKIIISDFSMFVKPGQNVAIVGPTGAGKTTLVKLLMRFYELNGGAIYVDGHNIRDYTRHDLRDGIGMVLQDAWLYTGTIADNVRYGKPDATMDEVIAACKQAHVHHFIKTLANGYDTVISEETGGISQGQKQLLTIARAFLKDPRILILDEATSSVDTRTEKLIQDGMEALMEGRTSFVIAHRLSTIKGADIILVLDHGDIVEVGNHESLLAQDGFYAKLYNSQFEGCE